MVGTGRFARAVSGAAIIATAAALPVGLTATSAAAAPATTSPAAASVSHPTRVGSADQEYLALVNAARRAAHVPPVLGASGLGVLSAWWSGQMASGKTWGRLQHNPDAFTQVTHYGAANRTAWGENVASYAAGTPTKMVFDAYMRSPGHRANILSAKYRYVGMGTVTNGSTTYNTMTFTDRVDARSAKAAKVAYAQAAKAQAARTAAANAQSR